DEEEKKKLKKLFEELTKINEKIAQEDGKTLDNYEAASKILANIVGIHTSRSERKDKEIEELVEALKDVNEQIKEEVEKHKETQKVVGKLREQVKNDEKTITRLE